MIKITKPNFEFNTKRKKRTEAAKYGDNDEKDLSKLMKNVLYGKIMENLRNSRRKTGKQRQRLFEMIIKTKFRNKKYLTTIWW